MAVAKKITDEVESTDATVKKERAERKTAKQKAQKVLDTADRKVARLERRLIDAIGEVENVQGQLNKVAKERAYAASHPSLDGGGVDAAVSEAIGDGDVAGGGLIDLVDDSEPVDFQHPDETTPDDTRDNL